MNLNYRLKELRIYHKYTQKYVAEYLGVDPSTYAHYESARRSPDADKLRMLAELYNLEDELLGVSLPIEMNEMYPQDLLLSLEKEIVSCDIYTTEYYTRREYIRSLQNALEPIIQIRHEVLQVSDFFVDEKYANHTVKRVYMDIRAELLITEAMKLINTLIEIQYE
ncbi:MULTISPECIES: helix-turn-helix domain-containing protein [unclassified Holdemanella]|uniref:helix-turn-helix domain-containing protein n=1 Tax=unclassified Holdemanella TaxID=2633909 RepID=UPI001D0AC534|nr:MULTISPECIES: helix-turn-helix transcriptional regulator [unclassified Holdemanella]MCB8641009.1 helix-turn-helix domain-containing protein [Holdemanella sp. DFI.5.55]MCG5649405.1 helix-turn-helix domain-containing protein [Holdemanella sp. DFI.5.21]